VTCNICVTPFHGQVRAPKLRLHCAQLTDDAPTVEGILPESLSFVRGGSLQPLSPNRKSCVNLLCQFASRWLAVERYQSIDDTMVQLFVPQTCGVMTFQSPVIAVSTITLEGDAKWGATSEFRLLCRSH
jgi:hypothetical protein